MKQTNLKTARPESPLLGRGLGEASYFTLQELSKSATAERLAIDNTPPRAAQQMLTVLVEQLLDPIRRRYGAPIIVTSGYRCPALNTAVGGVANSHHIVGCAADIVGETHPNPPCEGGNSDIAEPQVLPHREDLGGSRALFHLIVQMQREGAIHFTQLIAEKDYRWLHISYVPGMLRNLVIDVNACASERDASSLAIAQRTQPSVCDEVTNVDVNVDDNCRPEGKRSSQVSMTKSLTLASTLSLEETSALSLSLRDYQDSG